MTDDDLKALFERAVGDIRRHFDVTTERFDGRIDLLAESILQVDRKIERTTSEIRDEMRLGFADTHALIKWLDRRIGHLEERLESPQ